MCYSIMMMMHSEYFNFEQKVNTLSCVYIFEDVCPLRVSVGTLVADTIS